MKKRPFLEVAKDLFTEKFSDARVCFAAGALVRGAGTEKSDIDCFILFDSKNLPRAYRETIIYQDYICEMFIQSEVSFEYFTGKEPEDGRPIIQSMIMEGIPFGDRQYALQLKERMSKIFQNGPTVLDKDKIDAARYSITDLMDDIPAKTDFELFGTLSVLQQKLGDFYLRANNQWSGARKSLDRALRKFNQKFADKYGIAFEHAFIEKDFALLEHLVDEILAPFGGRLMENFKQFAPAKANQSVEQ